MKTPAIIASRLTAIAALSALVCVSLPSARAATLTWDTGAAGSPASAAGIWDNGTTANWTTDAGVSKTTWGGSSTDTAAFTGTTYTVTTANGAALSAGAFTAASGTSVTITAGTGSTLTLAGATPTFSGAGTIILGIQVQGSSGFSSSVSNLRFTTAATYTGNTTLTGGQLVLQGSNLLPSTTQLAMSGSAILTEQGNQSLTGLTGAAGNTIRNTTATNYTLTVTAGTNAFAGTLTQTSTGALGLTNSGGTLALTGTNSYKGATTVSGGTLSLGSNLASTGSVAVNGGTLTSTVANVNLGLGGASMDSGTITPRGIGTAGTFTLAANQIFSTTGGTLNFDVGTAFDQIIGSGTGTFSIGSGTTLALSLGTGFDYGSSYTLFSGFSGGSVASSGFSITGYDTSNWVATLSDTGVLSFTAASIPEPSAYAAFAGLALLGFAAFRRRETRA